MMQICSHTWCMSVFLTCNVDLHCSCIDDHNALNFPTHINAADIVFYINTAVSCFWCFYKSKL